MPVSIYEVTTVTPDLIRVEVRDPECILGYTEELDTPDSGTGTFTVTNAVDNGHGLIRLTTSYASSIASIYISNIADNGSGLIRCTVYSTSGMSTGNSKTIRHAKGCTEANGTWTITVIDGTTFDLQGSTFTNTYTGGASVQDANGGLTRVIIHSVGGTTEANNAWAASRSGTDTIDLLDSVFTNTYTSGGTLVNPLVWVQRTNPSTSQTDYCMIVGKLAKVRRYQDIRATEYFNRSAAMVAGNYGAIGNRTVTNVYLKSIPYSSGYGRYATSWAGKTPALSFKHFVYLKLDGTLNNGNYVIDFPSGTGLSDYNFTFDDKVTRCSAIHVDQQGHRRADTGKIAYFSQWVPGLGVHGELDLSTYNVTNWHLIDAWGNVAWSAGAAPIERIGPEDEEGASFGADAVPTFRIADPLYMKVSSITKSNPAVVTVDDASRITNGDKVIFMAMSHYQPGSGGSGSTIGMSQLEYTGTDATSEFTVANKSGNTFELSGIDSSSYSTFAQSSTGDKGNLCFRTYLGNRTGTYVYGLNYGGFVPTKDGVYRVYIPGFGVSDPIAFSEGIWALAAQVYAEGMYHERMGCAIDGRFGYTRPVTFKSRTEQRIYQSYMPYVMTSYGGVVTAGQGGLDVGANYTGVGGNYDPWITTTEVTAFGGHMDAGDWDSRIRSTCNGYFYILDTFEFLPEASRILNHNLPTLLSLGVDPTIYAGTENLPDCINEVIWGLEYYRASQGVNGEISGGLNYGEGVSGFECSWNGHEPLYAYYPDHVAAYAYAGAAAKLSRILSSLGYQELSNTYKTSAIDAFDWAETIYDLGSAVARDAWYLPVKTRAGWDTTTYNGIISAVQSDAARFRGFAAPCLFYLTGDSSYKTISEVHNPPLDYTGVLGAGAWEYSNAPGADSSKRSTIRSAITGRSLTRYVGYSEGDISYRNLQFKGFDSMAFGGGGVNISDSAPALIVASIIYTQDGNTANAARCLEALQCGLGYRHGANQNGICFTKGLGARNLLETLHTDSRNTSQGIPSGLCSEGWANKFPLLPTMLGTSWINPIQHPEHDPEMEAVATPDGGDYLQYRELYPPNQFAFPRWEFLMEHHLAIEHMEFTVQQQIIPAYYACLYLHGYDGNTQPTIQLPKILKLGFLRG